MAAAASQGWQHLRQQARQLESQTESLFHTYSQYTNVPNLPSTPSTEESKTCAQISDILIQRDTVLSSLTRLLDSDPTPSALKSSHLARHRETLSTHRADYQRLKANIQTARDRSNLLSSVRQDITSYRASNGPNAEGEYMLDERSRLDNSHNMADSVLSQAYAVNENFGMQREQLERIRRRVTGVVGMVPGVNSLIARIGTKKRRDGIILGVFISFCLLCLLYFM